MPTTRADAFRFQVESYDQRRREVAAMIEEADAQDDTPAGPDALADALMEIAEGWCRSALAAADPAPAGASGDVDAAWADQFIRAAASQLHDVNGHLRSEQNRPTSEPFDWTTNCQHPDCIHAREYVAAIRAGPATPLEPLDVDVRTVVEHSSPHRNCGYAHAFRAACAEVNRSNPESWCAFCQAHARLAVRLHPRPTDTEPSGS